MLCHLSIILYSLTTSDAILHHVASHYMSSLGDVRAHHLNVCWQASTASTSSPTPTTVGSVAVGIATVATRWMLWPRVVLMDSDDHENIVDDRWCPFTNLEFSIPDLLLSIESIINCPLSMWPWLCILPGGFSSPSDPLRIISSSFG